MIYFTGLNPFQQSDQEEQDSVDGEVKAVTESHEKAKAPPSGPPPAPHSIADRSPVSSLPVNTLNSQAETTEV